jgi:SpoVK/Ycf46/Vps4 family AAA+-type ATPase
MNKKENDIVLLDRYIRARYPILAIVSHEENRVLRTIQHVGKSRNRQVGVWSITTGLDLPGADQETTRDLVPAIETIKEFDQENPTIFVMLDMHPYLNDPLIVRYLRDVANAFESCKHTLILLSPNFTTPADLEKSITLIDWSLPTFDDLGSILDSCIRDLPEERVKLNGDKENVVRAMSGLTSFEASNVLASAIAATGELSENAIPVIVSEKKQVIRKSGVLEFFETDASMDNVGGLFNLKRYAAVKMSAFSSEAQKYGLDAPKGVILVGVPGTGKSLSVKAIAGGKMPLLRMDIGAIMGGLVGQSESNMRQALKVAEAVAPCVLWIDEIEKSLGGGSGELDGGTSSRVFGTLLTWMQETTAPVYVVATANDARTLKPELLRRFDDVFWVDLPNHLDRIEVLEVHLKKRGKDIEDIDLMSISNATWGFTGAEIEKVVKSALETAFFEHREPGTKDYINAAKKIIPISDTMKEKIAELRQWAQNRALPASAVIESKPQETIKENRFDEIE